MTARALTGAERVILTGGGGFLVAVRAGTVFRGRGSCIAFIEWILVLGWRRCGRGLFGTASREWIFIPLIRCILRRRAGRRLRCVSRWLRWLRQGHVERWPLRSDRLQTDQQPVARTKVESIG